MTRDIRSGINTITQALGYSLDEVYVTDDGDVWTLDDLEEARECGDSTPVQTAREWYDNEITP